MQLDALALVFFQAEDGIRCLVRSRGLVDVYKRQMFSFAPWAFAHQALPATAIPAFMCSRATLVAVGFNREGAEKEEKRLEGGGVFFVGGKVGLATSRRFNKCFA